MASKILIVDDMPDAIEFLPDWLQREGYTTLMATRGQQALALAEEKHPDVILLDVMMPGMDGIETCRRLRMNPATADIPVILVSARSPSEARAEGLLAGATDYITKPIHFPDLLERVSRIAQPGQDGRPDHRRLLEEMAYTALTVLPCNLSWLLIVDTDQRWLIHQTVAVDRGAEAARTFLSLMQGDEDDIRFSLMPGDNPLADAVLNRTVLINIPVAKLLDLPGVHRAFSPFAFISLLPLISAGRAVGLMLLATMDPHVTEGQRTQQILHSLSSQAAMVVDNARLLVDLAAQEAQTRAEQSFRQMVLDTMGEGLIVVDAEATITYVNNRLLSLTDYTREMLYGRSVGMIFHPAQRERLVKSLTRQRRDTLPFSQDLFTRHGKTVPVLLSRAVVPDDPDGSTVMVVTDLSELQRQEGALQLQTQRLLVINRVANAISSARSIDDVIMITLESALHVVNGMAATLLLRAHDEADMLAAFASIGIHTDQASVERIPVGEGLSGWVAQWAKSRLVSNLSDNDQFMVEFRDWHEAALQSVLAVPLIASDEVIGVLRIVNKHEGVFDEQDLKTLESLAASAAVAIENVRLFEQMSRRVNELGTLLDASAAVSSTLDFGDILERIARRLSVAMQVERVVIADWHRQTNQLNALAEVVNAYWAPGTGPVRLLHTLPLTRHVLETRKPAIAPKIDPRTTVEFNPSRLYSCAGFPVTFDNQTPGVVMLYSEKLVSMSSQSHANAVADVIKRWEAAESRDSVTRSNLTDLCQQVLQASGARWCSVAYHEPGQNQVRLLREIGRALWLEHPGVGWNVNHYPSLFKVLQSGEPLTLQFAHLDHDPHEQAYLRSVGGSTCLVAPLFIHGESKGLVRLIDSRVQNRVFDTAEISLCQGIANVVGNAMENAQLYSVQEQRASALEAAYTELQEADRIKDELLQNLSHELRTPLTHVLGYVRLIMDQAFGPLNDQQQEAMQVVIDKAQHLADLVKDIITVQESEAHNLEPKPVQIEDIVNLAIRSISGQAQARGIKIISRIPADLPLVYADPVRIGEVFEELLENAVKFSTNNTPVEVTLIDSGGPMLHASVRDRGVGIDPTEHEKIFRRFYQVESGTTRRFGGTGLGLAIVQQVVEGHNGRVWVESQLGEGSCFHLTLPKAKAMMYGD